MKTVDARPTDARATRPPERIVAEVTPATVEARPEVREESRPLVGGAGRASSVSWCRSLKIRGEHLRKLAIVYVRQSSVQQVVENRESTERQ